MLQKCGNCTFRRPLLFFLAGNRIGDSHLGKTLPSAFLNLTEQMWNWDFTQYQAPVTNIFWLSDFVLETSAGEHMRMSADNAHIDAGMVDKDGWHKLSSLDDDNWWQLSGRSVHQRTRANRPGCHPCPNVTSLLLFQPMSPFLLICNYFSPATALTR